MIIEESHIPIVIKADLAKILSDHIEKNGPAKPMSKEIIDKLKEGSCFKIGDWD